MAPPLFGCPVPSIGERLTGVFYVQRKIDEKLFAGLRSPTGAHVLLTGPDLQLGCVSIYDAKVMECDDILILLLEDEPWWKSNPDLGDSLSPHVVDLCAGTGAMSLAAQYLGAEPMMAVDWNEKAIELLHANHPGLTLRLDLTSRDAARTIHQACTHPPGTVFLGFPCQPHSTQGSQLGSADPRAQVLWHGLHITFMLQAQTLILECTPMAGENIDIKEAIESLATAMHWEIQTVTMDLLDVWPCRRNRWWALLFPKRWHAFTMTSWTLPTPFDSIRTIMPEWGVWSYEDEMALQLSPHELEMFHDVSYGHDKRNLDVDDTAAAFLHSYANALLPCPCGCRLQGFHPLTLKKGGLRGQYTISKVTGQPRYLHPKEVALLLGLPGSFAFIQDMRTSLALLGLVASPLQALWVYGHLLRNHRLVLHRTPCPRVEDWLRAYMLEILTQIPTGSSSPPSWTLDLMTNGDLLSLRSSQQTLQVHQFLHAERINLGWNESCTLQRGDCRLGLDEVFRTDLDLTLHMISQGGLASRPVPAQDLVVVIRHQDHLQVVQTPPGRFLFEILAGLGLPLVRKVIDSKDNVFPVDFRIWKPIAVTTLTDAPWNQPLGFFRQANGLPAPSLPGLHDGQIWAGLWTLTQSLESPFQAALLIQPALAPALVHRWISDGHRQALCHRYRAAEGRILCIFEYAGHWTLLYGQESMGVLNWTLFDGLSQPISGFAFDLAASISSTLGLDFCPPCLSCILPQLDAFTCGTVALLHLLLLQRPGLVVPATIVCPLHRWILLHLNLQGSIFATGLNELSADQVGKLSQLLRDHRVPDTKLSDRVQQTIQKLGIPAIVAAFVAKNSGLISKLKQTSLKSPSDLFTRMS
eukprot:s1110_g17.t1